MSKMITNTEVYNLERAIIASGYPLQPDMDKMTLDREVNERDMKRAVKLGNTPKNSGHCQYLVGILVSFDIEYTQFFAPQFLRYKFNSVISSSSKMHCLTKSGVRGNTDEYVDDIIIDHVDNMIKEYNDCENKDRREFLFKKIISNTPMGLIQKQSVVSNYLSIANMVNQRKWHKLDSWREFCKWAFSLPMFCELTGIEPYEDMINE